MADLVTISALDLVWEQSLPLRIAKLPEFSDELAHSFINISFEVFEWQKRP
jgi:hypothetical protein